MSIDIVENILTKNPCYLTGRKTSKTGEMLHSIGCPQPDPKVFVRNWNNGNTEVCVHGFIGKEPVFYQTLPDEIRAWHCGGAGNTTMWSAEMTEPSSIKYTGGSSWIELGDGSNTKAHVLATYRNAVEIYAIKAKKFGINPLSKDVLVSHKEGHDKGIASNHGDPEHIWKYFGLTMDQFRKDVYAKMNGGDITTVPTVSVDNSSDDSSAQKVNAMFGTVTVTYEGSDGVNVRNAPCLLDKYVAYQVLKGTSFEVVGISADEKWYKLSNGLYITSIPDLVKFKATEAQKESTAGTGYYRVRKKWGDAGSQIGAFKSKENAIALCKNNSGYKVFDNDGKEVYPCVKTETNTSFKFQVTIPDLRIRKGPGTTYDYHKNGGSAVYTGKGVFTIVETKDGPGAVRWGLLKAYSSGRNGWIALDESYGKIL